MIWPRKPLACGNFDKNTEILSWKNTVYDAFGIAYQNDISEPGMDMDVD